MGLQNRSIDLVQAVSATLIKFVSGNINLDDEFAVVMHLRTRLLFQIEDREDH